MPRYVARTVRLRLVRVPSTYSTWGPGGERPCASGTFTTREAGTHGLYVPYGGPRLYLSTQFSASPHTSRPAMRASSEAESTGSACGRAPCAGMTIEQHDEAHATHEAWSVPSTVESRRARGPAAGRPARGAHALRLSRGAHRPTRALSRDLGRGSLRSGGEPHFGV